MRPCPDELELALWADGKLPPNKAEAVARHVADCIECRFVVNLVGASAEEILGSRSGGGEHGEAGDGQLVDDEPYYLAADTDASTDPIEIPAHYAEGGRVVVTFRSDLERGVVTAHLLAADLAEIRHRPVRIGDQHWLSDGDGRIELEGWSALDAIAASVSVLTPVARWTRSEGTQGFSRDDLRDPESSASRSIPRVSLALQGNEARLRFETDMAPFPTDSKPAASVGTACVVVESEGEATLHPLPADGLVVHLTKALAEARITLYV